MRKILYFTLVLCLVLMLAACSLRGPSGQSSKYQAATVQQTLYGAVNGLEDKDTGTLSRLGVPYAKPPVGALRWTAPQNPETWRGVLETKAFASASLQIRRILCRRSFGGEIQQYCHFNQLSPWTHGVVSPPCFENR
jgi:para-nitrobenzyl esterase